MCFCFLGSPYYDNVRPLSYPDSDAVLICFDISRPETLDSVLKKVSAEEQGYHPELSDEIGLERGDWPGDSKILNLFLLMKRPERILPH